MTPEQAAQEANDKRLALRRMYAAVFCDDEFKLTKAGKAVLDDLEGFALVGRPSYRPPEWSPHQAAFEEGMRNVILHIKNALAAIEVAAETDPDDEPETVEVKKQ
jgi:hypothetical protein